MNTLNKHTPPTTIYQDHLSTCEYRDEQCTQCGQYIQHLNMSVHQREQCPMRLTTCPHCNKDVPIQQLQVVLYRCAILQRFINVRFTLTDAL